jgi:glutathione S-transferase
MTTEPGIVLYHAPHTRSLSALTLLEELGVPYRLHLLDLQKATQRAPDYLSVNPMGKVPAIVHDGVLITEQVAIAIYLADLFPAAGLAPAIGDPVRGPYLRWLVYYAACMEPAVIDHYLKREPASVGMCPYGDFDTMLKTVTDQLALGPWLLGERFSAADVVWGVALGWITGFGLIPKTPEIADYVARAAARPAAVRALAKDTELAASQAA